jgi:tRNA(Ile2)-agmatinylcytidine synthase
MRCLVGLDDTDSRSGHCTTHLGFRIVGDLRASGCAFSTYPRLVRLNPNIPFKTRGNAAVCLEFETDDPDGAFEIAETAMRELSDVGNGANSGLVFLDRERAPGFLRALYLSAVSGVVSYRRVLNLLSEAGIRHVTLGNGMGVVGAAASLGFRKEDDHTYELIAYRSEAHYGKRRSVGAGSVKAMERKTFPHTFNSYDHRSGRVLLTPHGPDPVFLGIRADSPGIALSAFATLDFEERLAGHMIYLSNQCTDAHLGERLLLPMKAYSSGWLEGSVEGLRKGPGGHLYLDLRVTQTLAHCAVYKPAADLHRAAGLLEPGDEVRVFGGVRRATGRHPAVLNVEKLEVLSLNRAQRWTNPVCANCGRVAKSEGTGKGFQCRSCGARLGEDARHSEERERTIVPGTYLPSSGAQRHLTKPLSRYGRELLKAHPLIEGWFRLCPSAAWGQADGLGSCP